MTREQKITFDYKSEKFLTAFACTESTLAELKEKSSHFLHPAELTYFHSLAFEKRQLSYLVGHYAAKKAIALLASEIKPNSILIEYGVFKFPLIHLAQFPGLQISYSHCRNTSVAIAYPDQFPMGIDLEYIDEKKIKVIATQLTAEEKKLIDQQENANPALLYCLFWSLKEALSKALRSGMMAPFKIYAVKHLQCKDGYWECEFENFAQYQAKAFIMNGFICAFVFAAKAEMDISMNTLKQMLVSN